MYYMSLTKYALQRAQLLFRISFLSLVTTQLSSHSFPQLHSALNSVDAERPQSSMGKHRVGCSTAAKRDESLDKWDAQLLHDDWMI